MCDYHPVHCKKFVFKEERECRVYSVDRERVSGTERESGEQMQFGRDHQPLQLAQFNVVI